MENNILTVRNVNVSYKNQKKNIFSKTTYQHVLKDVSFEMKEGEILGLVGSLIFAFIHFTIPEKGETFNANLANEFWNIPSYIVSGVILCRAYEKHQSIATSMIAHAINNFVAIVMTIISVFLG